MARLVSHGIRSSRRERRAARRPLRPGTRRALFALFLAVALSLGATAVIAGGATRAPVSLGEVSGKTPAGEYQARLRSAVLEELERAELGRSSERYVLSASIETLRTKQDGRRVSATAVVSLALRREKEQTLHAILRGNATAEASDVTLDSAREDALRAAVESAMRRLPEAVLPRRH
jgi:hypothetical protein